MNHQAKYTGNAGLGHTYTEHAQKSFVLSAPPKKHEKFHFGYLTQSQISHLSGGQR